MAGLLKWLQASSSRLFDPERDRRIDAAAAHIERELARQRSAFRLVDATRGLDLFSDDIPLAAREAYRSLLRRAWRDGSLSKSELSTLQWARAALGLNQKAADELQRDTGLALFEETLARAIDDGELSDDEISALQRSATELGWSLPALVRHYFEAELAALLRGMFGKACEDGALLEEEWARLISTARKLGFTERELLHLSHAQAKRFLEQSLADAIADQHISAQEESSLTWLSTKLVLDSDVQQYVRGQIERVKLLEGIQKGRLPSIRSNRLGLRAGEIVHAEMPGRLIRTRQLKNGPRRDVFDGVLTLTDDRLLFHAADLGCDVNHRRVIEIRALGSGFELIANGKGTGTYVPGSEAALFVRMYRVAVQKANQTAIAPNDAPGRHIPRDVRQRVWQRYGGQCAECSAIDYLEFDHIIPVAKGGGNTEGNVQLLCRRCNGLKSDRI